MRSFTVVVMIVASRKTDEYKKKRKTRKEKKKKNYNKLKKKKNTELSASSLHVHVPTLRYYKYYPY